MASVVDMRRLSFLGYAPPGAVPSCASIQAAQFAFKGREYKLYSERPATCYGFEEGAWLVDSSTMLCRTWHYLQITALKQMCMAGSASTCIWVRGHISKL